MQPTISQFWSFKIRHTTFLNNIKFADFLIVKGSRGLKLSALIETYSPGPFEGHEPPLRHSGGHPYLAAFLRGWIYFQGRRKTCGTYLLIRITLFFEEADCQEHSAFRAGTKASIARRTKAFLFIIILRLMKGKESTESTNADVFLYRYIESTNEYVMIFLYRYTEPDVFIE